MLGEYDVYPYWEAEGFGYPPYPGEWPPSILPAVAPILLDIHHTETEYTIEAELPGVQKDEVDVRTDNGRIKIVVDKKEPEDEDGKNYLYQERCGHFASRSVKLRHADLDKATARLADGVLRITVPKQEAYWEPKEIPVA